MTCSRVGRGPSSKARAALLMRRPSKNVSIPLKWLSKAIAFAVCALIAALETSRMLLPCWEPILIFTPLLGDAAATAAALGANAGKSGSRRRRGLNWVWWFTRAPRPRSWPIWACADWASFFCFSCSTASASRSFFKLSTLSWRAFDCCWRSIESFSSLSRSLWMSSLAFSNSFFCSPDLFSASFVSASSSFFFCSIVSTSSSASFLAFADFSSASWMAFAFSSAICWIRFFASIRTISLTSSGTGIEVPRSACAKYANKSKHAAITIHEMRDFAERFGSLLMV